jgi:hypothetical protein
MQQSGGLLLAAGLDGGNTLICSLGEQMQIESVLPSCILTATAVAFPQKSESVLSHLRKRLISAIIKKR